MYLLIHNALFSDELILKIVDNIYAEPINKC